MPAAASEPAQRPVAFADLFSGIGGFHLGIRRALTGSRARCAVTCEIDEGARRVYAANLLANGPDAATVVATDIRELSGAPYRGRLDLVCGGFPCQSYSSLGLRKGMRDQRGRLFNDLARFIGECQPRAFLLENVAGLLTAQKGAAFKKVSDTLSGLGYAVSHGVLDSQHFGLPQHRKRVYIVGRRVGNGTAGDGRAPPFDFSPLLAKAARNAERSPVVLRDILDPGPPSADLDCDIFAPGDIFAEPVRTRTGFVLRAKLSNFTNRKLFSTDGICGTITTGSPPPIYDERYEKARHLSARELKRAQGFPAGYRFPAGAPGAAVSRSEVVHYVGNAVSVNVIAAIVAEMERQGLLSGAN
jgi:site-specific DNA-cytosine methylase